MNAHGQVPAPGALNIDHVAHFVPDLDGASEALERMGFTPTPFSPQSHRLTPDGPRVPAGTGNRCVMFERGYLEFLTPTGDTPVADQLRTAIARYVGLHLIAFGTAAPDEDFERLSRGGYSPLPPLALDRPITTPEGESTARFTVVRVPPGTMAEGRIQFCHQHTPELLWQPRWTGHRNGVSGLSGVLLCVADPAEAASRYRRFTGLTSRREGALHVLETARGDVLFTDAGTLSRLGIEPPGLPWIAAYVLESAELQATTDCVAQTGLAVQGLADGENLVRLPPSLGGWMLLQQEGRTPAAFLRA